MVEEVLKEKYSMQINYFYFVYYYELCINELRHFTVVVAEV